MNEYAGREKEKAGDYLDPMEEPCILCGAENKQEVTVPLSLCEEHEDADVNARVPYLRVQLGEARKKLAALKELPLRHDKLPHATGGGCMSRCLACQRDRILKGGD